MQQLALCLHALQLILMTLSLHSGNQYNSLKLYTLSQSDTVPLKCNVANARE